MGAPHIPCPHIPGETVVHSIGLDQRISLIFKRQNREYWTKNFFLSYLHTGRNTGQQRRLEIASALPINRFTADPDNRPLGCPDLHVVAHLGAMRRVNQGP